MKKTTPIIQSPFFRLLGAEENSPAWHRFRQATPEPYEVCLLGPPGCHYYSFANSGINIFVLKNKIRCITFTGHGAETFAQSLLSPYKGRLPGNIKFEYGREWIAAAFGTHTLRHRSKPAKAQAKNGSERQRHWLRKESTARPESIESDMFAFEKYCVNCSYDLSANGLLVMVQLSVFDKLRQTEVFIANHQYKEAINLLQERVTDKGADFKATFDLAYCHEKLGQFEKAEEYYVRSLSSPLLKNVTVIPIHSSYANFLENRGRREEAFEQLLLIYAEHLRRDEDTVASLKRLTVLSAQMGMSAAELDARLVKVRAKKTRVRKT